MKAPVAVLISGGGTNLQALIDASASPDYPARVALVIADRHRAGGLARAREAGIPTAVVLKKDHVDRAAYDAAIVELLYQYQVVWVCLAGFMRLVTPVLLDAFPWRVLNIHPALLPAFPGLHAQAQALAHGVAITGATVHLVDAGMDTGPILLQGAVPVHQHDTLDTLRARILALEHTLYPAALRWAVESRFVIQSGKVHANLPPGARRFRGLDQVNALATSKAGTSAPGPKR